MATVQLSLPALEVPDVTASIELATDEVAQGVNTSAEDTDWNPAIVILAVLLIIAGVAGGIFGFRSTSRKKERLEDGGRDTKRP